MKRTKIVAFLTIITLLLNLFMPYSILFNNISYAATGIIEDKPVVINNLGVTQKGVNKVLALQLAISSVETITGLDVQFTIDTTKIEPCNKNTGAKSTVPSLYSKESDYKTATIQKNTYTSGTIRMVATEPQGGSNAEDNGYFPGTFGDPDYDDVGDGFYTYEPLITYYFRIVDSTLDTDNLVLSDLITLKPQTGSLPTGMTITYKNASNVNVGKNLTEFSTKGFAAPEKTITGISVKTNPTTTTYVHGQTVSLAGGEIEVTYDDNSTETVSMTDSNVSITAGATANVNNPTVSIAYKGFSTSFNLTVTDPVKTLVITTPMTNTEYSHGENLDFTGLVLTATKESGATVTLNQSSTGVTTDAGLTGGELKASINSTSFTQTSASTDVETRGTQEVTFTYEGKTTTATIIVNDSLDYITLKSQPTKQVFKRGEALDLSGAVVTAHLASGATTDINLPDGSVSIGTYSPTTTNTKQHLSVTFNGKTAADTIDVEAYNYITACTFTAPSKGAYVYNEALSVAGGKFRLTYHAGSPVNITLTDAMVTGFEPTTIGTQTLTATYNAEYTLSDGTTISDPQTATFQVEVTNPVKSIAITVPTKTAYEHGDSLDLSTGSILVTYENDATTTVPLASTMVTESDGTAVNMSPATSAYTNNSLSKTLKIKYTQDGVTETANYPITITNPVTGIAMANNPTDTNYAVNDTEYKLAGGSITVTRKAGNTENVLLTASGIGLTDISTLTGSVGTKSVGVTYEGKNTSFNISVSNPVTGVAITVPTKTAYEHGDSLELSTGKIVLTYADGTTTNENITASMVTENGSAVNMSPVASSYDATTHTLSKNLKITYTDADGATDTKDYNITLSNPITGIAMGSNPTKTSYNKGESEYDLTGGTITVTRKANDTETVQLSDSGVSITPALNTLTTSNGTKTVNVAYAGKTTSFNISVANPVTGVAITVPTKTEYKHGETLDLSTGTIVVTYADGSTTNENITASMVKENGSAVNMSPAIGDFDATHKANKTLTITYEKDGKSDTKNYPITIVNDVRSISVHTNPKLAYTVADNTLDITSGEILVTRAVGTPSVVSMSSTTQSGYTLGTVGNQTVTVSYPENGVNKTTSYGITISNPVTGVAITVPTKTEYEHGDSLDLSTGTILLTYADGTTTNENITTAMVKESDGSAVNMSPVASSYDATTHTLNKALKITYTDANGATDTKDYNITLSNPITGIAMCSNPTDTSYAVNDTEYKLAGGTITVTRKALDTEIVQLSDSNVNLTPISTLTDSVGTKSVTVTYAGETTSFNISVANPVKEVTITVPSKTEYEHGDSLDLSDGIITLKYADNSTTTKNLTPAMVKESDGSAVNMSPVASSYDATTHTLSKTLKITYTDASGATDTKDYNITLSNPITGIAMGSNPTDTSYNLNDTEYKLAGGTITVTRKANDTETVQLSDSNVSLTPISTLTSSNGTKSVTVTYAGKTTSFNISVANSVTDVAITIPTKTEYDHGEALDLSTGTIVLTYADGTTTNENITTAMVKENGSAVNMSPAASEYDANHKVNKTLTISYEKDGQSDTKNYPITITNDVKSISVHSTTHKTAYTVNDTLDVTNLEILVTRATGVASVVPVTSTMVSGFDSTSVVSSLPLTITYTENGVEKTTTYNISVDDAVSSVVVTAPTSTQTYNHGDSLDLTGATITVNYVSGATPKTVTPTVAMVFEEGTTNSVNMSPASYDSTNKVTKTVTLKYTEDGKTGSVDFPIEIINDVKSISIHTPANKLAYNMNESLDVTGLEIKVKRATGTDSVITVTEGMVEGFDSTSENTSLPLTIKYTENGIEKTVGYNVSVTDTVSSITVTNAPAVAKYGEALDLTGATIDVTKGSGTTSIDITEGMLSGYNKNLVDTQTVTVTYGGKTDTFDVVVKDYVTGISVNPSTVTGNYGDTLGTVISGVTYTVNYASAGAQSPVALAESMVAGYNENTVSAQSLTVTYKDEDTNSFTKDEEFTDTLNITLSDAVSSVVVTAPTSAQTYNHGDSLDLTGATITVNYASGVTPKTVTPTVAMVFEQGTTTPVNVSPDSYDSTNKVTKTVTLKYTEDGKTDSADFTIDIINDVKEISVFSTTHKTIYNLNESLDVTDLEIQVRRATGTPSIIPVTSAMVTGFDSTSENTSLPLTITYTENGIEETTTYNVSVQDTVSSISINNAPTTAKYGEELDLTGVTIDAVKGSGTSTIDVTESMISGFNKNVLGPQTVTITYGGQTDTFNVTVQDYVKGITVTPNEVSATYNKSLADVISDNSITYTVEYAEAGVQSPVTLAESMVTGYAPTDIAEQNLTVKYVDENTNSFTKDEEFTANLKITITDPITNITLVGTPTTDYEYGDEFDVTNLSLEITRGSGTTTIPVDLSHVVGYDKNTIGTQSVDIVYTDTDGSTHNATSTPIVVTVTDPVVSMEISTEPTNKEYRVNATLDVSGGKLKVTTKSGAISYVDITSDMVSGFDSSAEVVDQELTVTYQGFTDTYKITVAEPVVSIAMGTTPKTAYRYDDSLDVTNGTIVVTKATGTQEIPLAESMVSGFSGTQLGPQTLTVTYGGQTTTYEITVSDYVVGATFTPPTKDTYEYGESLELAGAKVQIVTASGDSETIDLGTNPGAVTISGYTPTQIGVQTVTITYVDSDGNEHTGTFAVRVENNIQSIAITTEPETSYKYGDSLDVTGGIITATRSDGTTETINITASMVTGFNPEELGNQTLTVTYEGFTDTYTVTVTDYVESIRLNEPDKKVYSLNGTIDLTGGSITEIMASGAEGLTTPLSESMISNFDTTTEGAKTVNVTYVDSEGNTHNETFGITVTDPISSIRLKEYPNKTKYLYGEELDLTGAEIAIVKESGDETVIPVTRNMVSGYNRNKLGSQTLTIKYNNLTTEFIVEVEDYDLGMKLWEPDKTEYEYGESLDLEGGAVAIITASGVVKDKTELTASMITNEYDETKVGTQTIRVQYKGYTDSFNVRVTDDTKAISIETEPDKTEYEYGEGINVSGGTIKVVKPSGTTIINITKDMISGYNPRKSGKQVITVTYDGCETSFVVNVKEKPADPEEDNNEEEDNSSSSSNGSYVRPSNTIVVTETKEPKPTPTPTPSAKPTATPSAKPTPTANTLKTETLGVQDSNDEGINTKALAGVAIGLMILALLLLTRRNVKVYVEEDGEFVLGGADRISKRTPSLDIDKFLDEETSKGRVKVVLNDNISEKLDGQVIEIEFNGNTVKIKVKYEDKPFEVILGE